ncbi:MAG: hypothetical protein V2G42_06060 [bacterium JZ-2024 1]
MLPLPLPPYLIRKILHFAVAMVVFSASKSLILVIAGIGALLSIVLPIFPPFRPFFYAQRDAGPLIYFLFIICAFLLFPFPIAALAWLILATGDAVAPIATLLPPIFKFRQTGKSFSGLLVYAASSLLVLFLSAPLLRFALPSIADLIFSVLASALLDACTQRPWDNFFPPLAAAFVLALP